MKSVPVVIGTAVGDVQTAPPPPRPSLVRRNTMMQTLLSRGLPPGLTKAMATSIESFPMRYVVVDNSGSMQNMDGQRLVQLSNGQFKPIQASRWAELGDLVMEMAEVASALGAATSFHMLNPTPIGQFFVIGESKGGDNHGGAETAVGRAGVPVDLSTLKEAMGTSPNSTTPLTESVEAIIRLITPAAAALRAHGQKCVVVLATDGLPNNPDSFLRALQELQQLPVWLVVRLCTDEDAVVEYWDDLDRQLEAPLETLDDVASEAKEVARFNPWLNYAPSLHLARTMGMADKLYDLLDETALLPAQAKTLIENLLGCGELPEPQVELGPFLQAVKRAVAELPKVYNPLTGGMSPWVDVSKLERLCKYGPGRSSSAGGCVIA